MKMTKTTSTLERAEILLRDFFATADGEPVSRHSILLELGGSGHAARDERRRWAEAWQLLEQSRMICREALENRGSDWFLTGAGHQALSGGDIEGALLLGRSQL